MKRKTVCFTIALVLLAACSQTNEERAEALIEASLKKELYHPDTYQSVETRLDSAFAPYDDPVFFDQVEALVTLRLDVERLDSSLREAKDTMAVLTVPMSAADEQQYDEARRKYEACLAELDEVKYRGDSLLSDIVATLQHNRRFIGYKAVHHYRADDNKGAMQTGHTVFYIDSLFARITYSLELSTYEKIQTMIADLKETIAGKISN
ncbi:MAG: hypothetical protein K5683_07905 [Prevotella sp.]|nr:hypothetical protein [Prevotella sp.]